METAAFLVLLVGALAGGFVSGLTGFGTGLVALGIWLYAFPPSVAVPLVLICSIVSQTATLMSFWRLIDFKLVWPFLVGGLAGVLPGVMLVAHADPRFFKLGVGLLLLVFPTALYFSRRPLALTFGGGALDTLVGFAGGVPGGLAGPLPTLWASVRGWGKDERRGVFQTFNHPDRRAMPAGRRRAGYAGRGPARNAGTAGDNPGQLAWRPDLSRAQ
jgi:uncharacterized protein